MNAPGASAGDFFVGLQAPDGSPRGAEVWQCKFRTAGEKITHALFQQEYKKSVSAKDFFMLITTARTDNFILPKNSGIVDADNWFVYFRLWTNRLFMFRQVNIGDTRQKKRKNDYEDLVDPKRQKTS